MSVPCHAGPLHSKAEHKGGGDLLAKQVLYPANGGSGAGWKVVVVVTVFLMLRGHIRVLHRTLCILNINKFGEK